MAVSAIMSATSDVEAMEHRYHVVYVITALFLFYAAVAGNFIDSLIGRGMHDLLQYRWMKHLMAFFILLFTISLVSAERDAWVTLLLSMGLYVWFLLTTKMDKWLNLAIVILLAVGFFLHRLLDTRYTVAWSQHDLLRLTRRR